MTMREATCRRFFALATPLLPSPRVLAPFSRLEENREMDIVVAMEFLKGEEAVWGVERNYYMGRVWGIVGWDNIDLSSLLIQTLMEQLCNCKLDLRLV